MMICDADFDELFPSTAQVKRPVRLGAKPTLPDGVRPEITRHDEASLARRADDGDWTQSGRKAVFLGPQGNVTRYYLPEKDGLA